MMMNSLWRNDKSNSFPEYLYLYYMLLLQKSQILSVNISIYKLRYILLLCMNSCRKEKGSILIYEKLDQNGGSNY